MHKKGDIPLLQALYYAFDKYYKNYSSINIVLCATMWYSADSWVDTPRYAQFKAQSNAKVAPKDMILLVRGCIVCILMNINLLFAAKGI